MKKEENNDALTAFLRTHRPDVPAESAQFEEQLLRVTVRRSWRHRWNTFTPFKGRFAFATVCAAALIVVLMNRPKDSVELVPTPTLASTRAGPADMTDDDAVLFFVESWDAVQSPQNTDVLSSIDSI